MPAGTETTRHRSRSRAPRGERGVSAVEAAILTPLVVIVLFGLFEGALVMHSDMTVAEMTGDGARAGSIARDDLDADHQILQQIDATAAWFDRASIERIVIWHAADREDSPPPGCTSGPVASSPALECSVYGPADLTAPPGALVCGWCPPDRDAGELLGVWVRFDYSSVSSLLDSVSLDHTTILPIEYDR